MNFIGDLSCEDANLLAKYARTANSILEFGAGGSTQIIAMSKPENAKFLCVETDQKWIDRTRSNLSDIGLLSAVEFVEFEKWVFQVPGVNYDMIFVDGYKPIRESFFRRWFPWLKVGGHILVHDTRRLGDLRYLLKCCLEFWMEVDTIQINAENSNISVVTKRHCLPHRNWTQSECREQWESGHEPPPNDWMDRLQAKREIQKLNDDWK